jgi:hypothetical protein
VTKGSPTTPVLNRLREVLEHLLRDYGPFPLLLCVSPGEKLRDAPADQSTKARHANDPVEILADSASAAGIDSFFGILFMVRYSEAAPE